MPTVFDTAELEDTPKAKTVFDTAEIESPSESLTRKPELSITLPKKFTSTTQGGPPLQLQDANPFQALTEGTMSGGESFAPLDPSPRMNLAGAMPEVKPEDTMLTAGLKTAGQAAAGLPDFFTSDAGVFTVAASLIPGVRQAIGAYWAQDLLRNAYKEAKQAVNNWDSLTDAQKGQAVASVALNAGMGVASAGLGIGVKSRGVSPAALGETIARIPKGPEGAVTAIKALEQAKETPKETVTTPPIVATKKEETPPETPAAEAVKTAGEAPTVAADTMKADVEKTLAEGKAAPAEASQAASERAQEIVKPKGPMPAIRVGDKTFGAQSHAQALSDAESQLGRPLKPEEIERGWLLNDKMFILEETPKEKPVEQPTTAPQEPSPAKAKEPWEMTKLERGVLVLPEELRGTPLGDKLESSSGVADVGGVDVTKEWNELQSPKLKQAVFKAGWEVDMDRKNRLVAHTTATAKAELARHKQSVQQAIREGKITSHPDYPELGKKSEALKATTERVSILIRVNSHRARDRMKSMLGDIGTNLQKGLGGGEFYAVTPSEFEKIKNVPGISKSKPSPNLGTALFGGEDFEPRYHEARRRLKELVGEKQPAPLAEPPTMAGPGSPAPGEVGSKPQIQQLGESFEQPAPLAERAKAMAANQFQLSSQLNAAKDATSQALGGLFNAGRKLVSKWKDEVPLDRLLQEKGALSAEMETRGYLARQTANRMKSNTPDIRRRAAITKWIDAGGDDAVLRQGEAETKPEFRQAYRDAQNLTPDEKIKAQNIGNYFDSRLQEAIDAGVLETGIDDYIHRIYEHNPELARRASNYLKSGILSTNPSLAKKRFFQFDWEAEREGLRPVQDFIPRVIDYETSLSRAIAARHFIARLGEMKAPDGRPVLAIEGLGKPIEDNGVRQSTLVLTHAKPEGRATDVTLNDRSDYKPRPEYPALRKWKWLTEDENGKPIYMQGDALIHPDFVDRIDKLLKPSSVKKYAPGRLALGVSSTFKNTMLDFSMFHQVQIAVHGMEHGVWALPGEPPPLLNKIFSHRLKDIDFEDPNTQSLLRGGVTLGGEYHAGNLGEGLLGKSISSQIPFFKEWANSYHSWLFQDFIPRTKMTMALHALERNRARFAGKLSEPQIAKLTADQANAAFGELNYIMLERSQTARDISRLIMLAPDFLEARTRFAGQALTKGGKGFGNEQRMALLAGALTMYITARIANKLADDQYHFEPENAFSFVHNGHAYSLRTVQGDIMHLIDKPVGFWLNRLNPLTTRTLLEMITERDQFGRKRTRTEALWDTVSNVVPISLRNSRERKLWESMMNSFGGTVRRWNDADKASTLAKEFKAKKGSKEPGEFIYDSEADPKRPLKLALSGGDNDLAVKELTRLLDSKTPISATKSNRDALVDYFNRYKNTGLVPKRLEGEFMASLTEDQKKTVEAALQHRKAIANLFMQALGQYDDVKHGRVTQP